MMAKGRKANVSKQRGWRTERPMDLVHLDLTGPQKMALDGTVYMLKKGSHPYEQFAHNPTERHCKAVLKILAYLDETKDLGIPSQRGSGLGMKVHEDASYADGPVDRRSVSGIATMFGGAVVSHKCAMFSKHQ